MRNAASVFFLYDNINELPTTNTIENANQTMSERTSSMIQIGDDSLATIFDMALTVTTVQSSTLISSSAATLSKSDVITTNRSISASDSDHMDINLNMMNVPRKLSEDSELQLHQLKKLLEVIL